jgi:hypothetical protein
MDDSTKVKATSGMSTRGTPCETFYHYHVACDSTVFGQAYCRGLQSAYHAHCVNDGDPLATHHSTTQLEKTPQTFAVSRRKTPKVFQPPSSTLVSNPAACLKGQLLSYISSCTSQGNSQEYCRNLQSLYHSECVAK